MKHLLEKTKFCAVIKLPGNCHYVSDEVSLQYDSHQSLSRGHYIIHCSGPMTDKTCRCVGGHSGGPLADIVKDQYTDEIAKQISDQKVLYSSNEYKQWLQDMDNLIDTGVNIIPIRTSTFGRPNLLAETIKIYNIKSKDGQDWFLVKKRMNNYMTMMEI